MRKVSSPTRATPWVLGGVGFAGASEAFPPIGHEPANGPAAASVVCRVSTATIASALTRAALFRARA